MAIKIPDTHYVGIDLTRTDQGKSAPLAFLTPGGTDAAAQKRQATVNHWCGKDGGTHKWVNEGDAAQFEIDNPDAEFQRDNPNGRNKLYITPNKEGKSYKILNNVDNEPLLGFRITKSVGRYGSWNGGNKVVRIEDPRGFELEINVDNLVKLMSMSTFTKGVCDTECVWGREGSTNVLLPVNSDIYEEAVKATKRFKAENIPLRQVKIGDIVELKAEHLPDDERVGVYCGLYRMIVQDAVPHEIVTGRSAFSRQQNDDDGRIRRLFDVYKRYIIKVGGTYHAYAAIKVAAITGHEEFERVELAGKTISNHSGYLNQILVATPKAVTEDALEMITKSVEATDIRERVRKNSHYYYGDRQFVFAATMGGGYMFLQDVPNHNRSQDASTRDLFVGKPVKLELDTNKWSCTGPNQGARGCGVLGAIKSGGNPGLDIIHYDWITVGVRLNDNDFYLEKTK